MRISGILRSNPDNAFPDVIPWTHFMGAKEAPEDVKEYYALTRDAETNIFTWTNVITAEEARSTLETAFRFVGIIREDGKKQILVPPPPSQGRSMN